MRRRTAITSLAAIAAEVSAELAIVGNYARIGLRNLWRDRLYAFINLGGLSLGIAACLLILIFVAFETRFDRHHEHADRIYRVARVWHDESGAEIMRLARISIAIGPALEYQFPEVERSVRLWNLRAPVAYRDRLFSESGVFLVDSSYFEVFTAPMLAGDPRTALTRPNTAVVTPAIATKYFGSEDPIGKRIQIFGDTELEITGLAQAPPPTSHVQPDILVSLSTGDVWLTEEQRGSWGSYNNFGTYVLLARGANGEDLADKLPEFIRSHYQPENNSRDELILQSLTDIHLHSALDAEFEANGNAAYVYLFLTLAFFVLLVACFNFVNLATARSLYRSLEVGMRKVLGARPGQIARQFLGEALVLTFVSTLGAVAIVFGVLPEFGRFTGRDLGFVLSNTWGGVGIGLLVAVVVLVGLIAGGYPALVLSRFRPVDVLKNRVAGGWKSPLRSILVVIQFAIAVALIAAMVVVLKQVDYVQSKQLGFEKDLLVALPANDRIRAELPTLRDRLLASRHVTAVTASNLIPSSALVDNIGVEAEVNGRMVTTSLPLNPVDHDFVPAYGMEVVAGRNFDKALASDSTEAFVLNEAAVSAIGWDSAEDAVGSRFIFDGNNLQRIGTVVGVVRDFHFESLRERISPLVLFIMPDRYRNVTVRIAGADLDAELAYLESAWREYAPDEPFRYAFIDQGFGALYESERKLGEVFGLCGGLAILIACLGLFGLASFITERRTKEIGIRKALGASVASIVVTLSGGFLIHVGVAALLAAPVTFIFIRAWLGGFAYRTELGPGSFLISGFAVAALALAAVGFEAVKSARANPVASLRDN